LKMSCAGAVLASRQKNRISIFFMGLKILK
jgi:hypothetical protein